MLGNWLMKPEFSLLERDSYCALEMMEANDQVLIQACLLLPALD